MKKLISMEIGSCCDCPYLQRVQYLTESISFFCSKLTWPVKPNDLPGWCPLPDFKSVEENVVGFVSKTNSYSEITVAGEKYRFVLFTNLPNTPHYSSELAKCAKDFFAKLEWSCNVEAPEESESIKALRKSYMLKMADQCSKEEAKKIMEEFEVELKKLKEKI